MADKKESIALVSSEIPPAEEAKPSSSDVTAAGGLAPNSENEAAGERLPLNPNNSTYNGNEKKSNEDEETKCSTLAEFHENVISDAGFGKLQWILFFLLGLGIFGDGVELYVIAIILPSAERDLCMTSSMKGLLGSIAFVGMFVGAILWGSLADTIGRRSTLMTSFLLNLAASVAGAFVPNYALFLVCRFIAGAGIGGSIPIVFCYLGEFCPKSTRGKVLSFVYIFWGFGGVYVASLGWLIVPQKGLSFVLPGGMVFNSWRVFLLVCCIPIVILQVGLFFMPESPRFLLEVGRHEEALAIYRRLYKMNKPGGKHKSLEVSDLPVKPEEEAVDDKECNTAKEKAAHSLINVIKPFASLFRSPLTTITLMLGLTWFAVSYGFYGLGMWFPELMKKQQQQLYFSYQVTYANQTYVQTNFTGFLENVKFKDSAFYNVDFSNLTMVHVEFENVLIQDSIFSNVRAQKTKFINSLINNTVFDNTNFYPNRFHGTFLQNVSFINTVKGCTVDFDVVFDPTRVYKFQFLGVIPSIFGGLITTLIIDKVGRVKILGVLLLCAGVVTFFFWFLHQSIGLLVVFGLFNFLMAGAWCGLEVMSTELYPTHLRSTGFGVFSGLGRIAAIIGNVTFGQLIDVARAIPVIITATIMILGGFGSLRLPESKDILL